jgi:hypothetical protein
MQRTRNRIRVNCCDDCNNKNPINPINAKENKTKREKVNEWIYKMDSQKRGEEEGRKKARNWMD